MKITAALFLASMTAGLVTINAGVATITNKTTTSPSPYHAPAPPPPPHPRNDTESIVATNPETTLYASKHKGKKKHGDKDKNKDKKKDKKEEECKFAECKACVHRCGGMKGFTCIYFQCITTVCKHCGLRIVHPKPKATPVTMLKTSPMPTPTPTSSRSALSGTLHMERNRLLLLHGEP